MINLKQFQDDFFTVLTQSNYAKKFTDLADMSISEIEARFAIYRNSILGTKQNALKTIYPVCIRLIGEECFAQLSNAYLEQIASDNPDLTQLAAHLAEFIQKTPLINEVPYLTDIAQLEWAWHNVFYGSDNETLDLQALSLAIQSYGDRMIFSSPSDARIISSTYPIDHIWKFCQPEYVGDTEINYDSDPVNLIIWQKNKSLLIERLTTNEFQLLQQLSSNLSWDHICKEFSQHNSSINLSEVLPQLCQRDLIRYQIPT